MTAEGGSLDGCVRRRSKARCGAFVRILRAPEPRVGPAALHSMRSIGHGRVLPAWPSLSGEPAAGCHAGFLRASRPHRAGLQKGPQAVLIARFNCMKECVLRRARDSRRSDDATQRRRRLCARHARSGG